MCKTVAKNRQNIDLNDKWWLNEGQKYRRMLHIGAFCKTFGLHSAIIGLENQFSVLLRVAVLHMFHCTLILNRTKDDISVTFEPRCEKNLSSGNYELHSHRPACAKAQSDKGLFYSIFGKYHT